MGSIKYGDNILTITIISLIGGIIQTFITNLVTDLITLQL